MWYQYETGNNTVYLVRDSLLNDCGNGLQTVLVEDDNKTMLRVSSQIINIRNELKIDISSQMQALKTPGLHYVTIKAGDQEQHLWFYQPRAATLSKFKVRIETCIRREYLLLHIKSEVPLSSGRLYYQIEKYPFHFSFPEIKKDEDYYFLMHKAQELPRFYIAFDMPKETIYAPQQCEKFGLGIEIEVTEKESSAANVTK